MYYEIKAYGQGKTRFENLDSFEELQDFCNKYKKLGFVKLCLKAFNEAGFVGKRYYTYNPFTDHFDNLGGLYK